MTAINSNRAIRGPVTAVPVVAGKGVRLVADTENNRIVAEADETVLWSVSQSDTQIYTTTDFDLSEAVRNFERVRIYFKYSYGPNNPVCKIHSMCEALTDTGSFSVSIPSCSNGEDTHMYNDLNAFLFNSTKPTKLTVMSVGKRTAVFVNESTLGGATTNQRGIILLKVIGINRIAGGE